MPTGVAIFANPPYRGSRNTRRVFLLLFQSEGITGLKKPSFFKDRTSNQKYTLVYLQKKPFLCNLKQKA